MKTTNGDIELGEPPTADDMYWAQFAEEESPQKSLDRLDAYGKYLLATVSTVGTALTGFGIFSPRLSTSLVSGWLLIPVGLACLSLAAAVFGITPQVHRLNRSDVISVRRYFASLIRLRGWSITIAGWLFALSLAAAAAVIACGNSTQLEPVIALRLSGIGSARMLTATAKFVNLPPSAIANIEILGYSNASNSKPVSLFDDVSKTDAGGSLSLSADGLSIVGTYTKVVVHTRVRAGEKVLYDGLRSLKE